MKAKSRQLRRSHVRTEHAPGRSIPDQLRQEGLQALTGLAPVSALVQPHHDCVAVIVTGAGKERVSMKHCLQLFPRPFKTVLDVHQFRQMGLDLAFVPRNQDGFNVREVLVQGRPSNASTLRYRGHRDPGHTMARDQARCGIKNCPAHSLPVYFDRLVPKLGHTE